MTSTTLRRAASVVAIRLLAVLRHPGRGDDLRVTTHEGRREGAHPPMSSALRSPGTELLIVGLGRFLDRDEEVVPADLFCQSDLGQFLL